LAGLYSFAKKKKKKSLTSTDNPRIEIGLPAAEKCFPVHPSLRSPVVAVPQPEADAVILRGFGDSLARCSREKRFFILELT
jgi:hypothetical protein